MDLIVFMTQPDAWGVSISITTALVVAWTFADKLGQ